MSSMTFLVCAFSWLSGAHAMTVSSSQLHESMLSAGFAGNSTKEGAQEWKANKTKGEKRSQSTKQEKKKRNAQQHSDAPEKKGESSVKTAATFQDLTKAQSKLHHNLSDVLEDIQQMVTASNKTTKEHKPEERSNRTASSNKSHTEERHKEGSDRTASSSKSRTKDSHKEHASSWSSSQSRSSHSSHGSSHSSTTSSTNSSSHSSTNISRSSSHDSHSSSQSSNRSSSHSNSSNSSHTRSDSSNHASSKTQDREDKARLAAKETRLTTDAPHCVGDCEVAGPKSLQASSATEDNTTTDEANASLDGAASGNESLLDNISSTIYGDRECPCMQLDKLPYTINITMISAEAIVEYPADVGGHCQAWDDGVAPSCEEGGTPGEGQDWCAKKWCYVDPCSCNISIQPKASNYFPTAFLDGRPLYYSYATCGDEVDAELVKEDDSAMCSTPSDEKIVGSSDCSCIGIAELPGTRPIYADGAYADYPGGAGSSCQAWDMDRHPDCVDINGSAPEWCSQPWCFVDPCSCDVAAEPATYLPGAKFQGKPLYYSYSTCGGIDTYNNETGTQNYTGNCEAWPVVPKGGSNIGVIVGVVVAVVVVAAVVFAVAA